MQKFEWFSEGVSGHPVSSAT